MATASQGFEIQWLRDTSAAPLLDRSVERPRDAPAERPLAFALSLNRVLINLPINTHDPSEQPSKIIVQYAADIPPLFDYG
jgi:hypothetical protein